MKPLNEVYRRQLKEMMLENDWSYHEVAEAMRKFDPQCPISNSTVSLAVRGKPIGVGVMKWFIDFLIETNHLEMMTLFLH